MGRVENQTLGDDYLETVAECDADLVRRNKLRYRSYEDYEREVRGYAESERLSALTTLHGEPKTSDGAVIKLGMEVFTVIDLNDDYEGDSEYAVTTDVIENFDYIFNHWMIKVQRRGLIPSNRLYSTQLAATGYAVSLYRGEINEIEAKINALTQNV